MIDSSAFQGKKAAYYTLGCKLNFSETSTFGKMLEDMGVITAKKPINLLLQQTRLLLSAASLLLIGLSIKILPRLF